MKGGLSGRRYTKIYDRIRLREVSKCLDASLPYPAIPDEASGLRSLKTLIQTISNLNRNQKPPYPPPFPLESHLDSALPL